MCPITETTPSSDDMHALYPLSAATNWPSDYNLPSRPPRRGNSTVRCVPDGSEAIWTEDLKIALIEALQIYPPMGRHRMRNPHSDGNHQDGHPSSLGRCQLIQAYMKQKTGKTRTRKQISSRLQRLRRLHNGEPKMMELLRVVAEPPDYSALMGPPAGRAATPTQSSINSSRISSPSTDLELQAVEPSASEDGSVPRAHDDHSWQGDLRQDNLAGFSTSLDRHLSSNCAAPSMSRRRFDSALPMLSRQVQLPLASDYLHPPALYNGYLGQSSALYSAPEQLSFHSLLPGSGEGNWNPITPVDQVAHTPNEPPEISRSVRRGYSRVHFLEKGAGYFHIPDTAATATFQEQGAARSSVPFIPTRTSPLHPSRVPNDSFPPSPMIGFPGQAGTQFLESSPRGVFDDILRGHVAHSPYLSHLAPQLPRRLSYSEALRVASSSSSIASRSPLPTVQRFGDAVSHSFAPQELASPALIKSSSPSDLSYGSNDSSLGSHNNISPSDSSP
ncbi:hypothetical protein BV25DRAFT_1992617 [Artomyces pyxidatus]|uniref:Uncharacterized protein n=1 Tax=Artomyces pyxidatus TaxID=48021 RepID=A0ACB8SXA1_9AGAM|nr:hypothetical protein BV25DRAFT_1992617 [Artomyces pyxidatus]